MGKKGDFGIIKKFSNITLSDVAAKVSNALYQT